MITNEMKAKIFGLYLGCNYKYYNMVKTVDGLVVSDIEDGDHPGNPKLILTPLSEVSEDDIYEMCKIISLPQMDGEYVKEIIDGLMKGDSAKFNPLMSDALLVIDFLRSRGYMLPYMGIDLFESSIAIPNNKKK